MEKDLISIIVPVYNVEKYLKKCVYSILNQTYSNLELILIDDGSTDNSGNICDNFIEIDKRIKIIHKKNGGLSDARNVGLKNISGDYVTFVDSDDTLEKDCISYLYSMIKNNKTDMSICSFSIITSNGKINLGKNSNDAIFSTESCLENMLCTKGFGVSACAKMYKSSLFDNIIFPLNKLCEDNGTTYKLINKCKKISYGKEPKYNYYRRNGSIMKSKFNEKKLDMIEMTDEMCDFLEKKYPSIIDSINKKRIEVRFSILRQMAESNYNGVLTNEIVDYIKKHRNYIRKNSKLEFRDRIAFFLLNINIKCFKKGWLFYKKIRYGEN